MCIDANNLVFRAARRDDCPLILRFIKGIAEYERLEDSVATTVEMLEEWLFDKRAAEVLFAMADGTEAGFALFFQNFSTFTGKGGLYLEDIFVLPEYRGRGIGKATMRELARVAVERGYARAEWACLDWNASAIDFYKSLGATPMDEWTVYRLTGDALTTLGTSR